jgi:hypothetical protein
MVFIGDSFRLRFGQDGSNISGWRDCAEALEKDIALDSWREHNRAGLITEGARMPPSPESPSHIMIMKEAQDFSAGLARLLSICAALLLAAGCATETPAGRDGAPSVRVVYLKGRARYQTGNNDWRPLKLGDVVKPGTIIQTASNSRLDLDLGDGSVRAARPAPDDMNFNQPAAKQDIVQLWDNTLMGVDKLTRMHTGTNVVTETQLDLKAGNITGSVRKISAPSKYEVKIPNGVAGTSGATFDISAGGLIKVRGGSVVVAYVGPGGTVATQAIEGLQMFDTRTGVLSSTPHP